jgi:hypothetical protein
MKKIKKKKHEYTFSVKIFVLILIYTFIVYKLIHYLSILPII